MDARNSVDEDYQSSGLRSSAVVPLISKGRTIGSLGFRSTNPARYGPKEQAIIIRLANQIAPAVENAQLYAARVQAEEALQASAARCQAVMDTAPDGIITTDHIGCIETFNPAAEAIFGYSIDEVLGKNVSMLMPEPDGGAHSGYVSRYLTTGEARVIGTGREEVGWRKDGTTFPMDLSIGVVEIGGHKIFTGIIRDITERKRTEARLNESIRLASVGELAAGVAHEINNPLAAIILASDFLSKSGLSGEKSADVKTICDAAQRAARIVQNMVVFAHKTDSKPERMKIDLVAKQALEWKTRDFRLNKIECKIIIETGLPDCFIDRHQMGQVIINVLNNAEHALTHRAGGNITIDIRSTSGLVILEVRDDGPGIEPELVPKIFDPFFTTKAAGEGTGLGLSICYGIIQQHGGEMWAANNKGAGTSIFIQLPIAGDESICQPATPLLEKAASVSTTRLLVTDDEPAILDLITRDSAAMSMSSTKRKAGRLPWR
jgi:PAS domain S-box-containing protein